MPISVKYWHVKQTTILLFAGRPKLATMRVRQQGSLDAIGQQIVSASQPSTCRMQLRVGGYAASLVAIIAKAGFDSWGGSVFSFNFTEE